MAELAANSLLPTGGAGGLALGVWALRQAGMPTGHIARRTVAFFVVTSAANFFALIVVGVGVFVGVIAGRGSAALTLVPALITALGVLVVGLSPKLLRGLGDRKPPAEGEGRRVRAKVRLHEGLAAAADGVEQAIALLRSHSLGVIVGSFAYMAFDIAALGFGFAAVGHVPPLGTLVLGYLIGQLGNLIPVPGGVGGTEGALIGVFALYGVNISEATAAVLLYRLFQLAIPDAARSTRVRAAAPTADARGPPGARLRATRARRRESAGAELTVLAWLRKHDPDYAALRRAARTALVMPALFAIGDKVIGNPTLATSRPSARSRCSCSSISRARSGTGCSTRRRSGSRARC